MRPKLVKLGLLVVALSVWGLAELCANSLQVDRTSVFLRSYFERVREDDVRRILGVEEQARERADIYRQMIEERFLDRGMVANRHLGKLVDQCDSLLFSSLRYVALRKLGYTTEAEAAWEAIRASHVDGKWRRHPSCMHWTSRDMIIGLMAALTQRPEGYREILQDLITYAGNNAGFIGDGPFYVSYLSPGLAEVLRHFARIEGFDPATLPSVVRYGFSTMEIDTLAANPGFQSHLTALVTWIELELKRMEQDSQRGSEEIRSIPLKMTAMTRALAGVKIKEQRLAWITQRLVDLDRQNMFFRYLRLRTAKALTVRARLVMLEELLAMPQFPVNKAPDSCDRRADYLWQRSSDEYQPRFVRRACTKSYNGVDFLWMVALLLEDQAPHQPPVVLSH